MKSNKNRPLITAALLAAICAPAWAINKCTGVDGKVTFQDAPCITGTGGPLAPQSTPVSVSPQVMSPSAIAKELNGQVKATLQKQAEARSKVTWQRAPEVDIPIPTLSPGMTSAQVQDLWGKASSVNETITAVGKSEQWVYPRGRYETQYVFIFNNVVTSVSTTKH